MTRRPGEGGRVEVAALLGGTAGIRAKSRHPLQWLNFRLPLDGSEMTLAALKQTIDVDG